MKWYNIRRAGQGAEKEDGEERRDGCGEGSRAHGEGGGRKGPSRRRMRPRRAHGRRAEGHRRRVLRHRARQAEGDSLETLRARPRRRELRSPQALAPRRRRGDSAPRDEARARTPRVRDGVRPDADRARRVRTARLHRQRHLPGPSYGRDRRSLERTRRPRAEDTPPRLRPLPRGSAARPARNAVRRALRPRRRARDDRRLPRDDARGPCERASLRRVVEAYPQGRRNLEGAQLPSRRRLGEVLSGARAAHRMRPGAGVASGRRRLEPHALLPRRVCRAADGRRRGRPPRRTRRPLPRLREARVLVVRSGQEAHPLARTRRVRRGAHAVVSAPAHERGEAPQGDTAARAAPHASVCDVEGPFVRRGDSPPRGEGSADRPSPASRRRGRRGEASVPVEPRAAPLARGAGEAARSRGFRPEADRDGARPGRARNEARPRDGQGSRGALRGAARRQVLRPRVGTCALGCARARRPRGP